MHQMVKLSAGVHARTTRTTIQFPTTSITDSFSADDPRVVGPLLSSSDVPTSARSLFSQAS
jgi:hypothetical protein